MLDDTPWFRRWSGFSFVPISWQGWIATIAFLLVEAPLMWLSLQVEAESFEWWVVAASAFALFLGYWAFVLWKSETL